MPIVPFIFRFLEFFARDPVDDQLFTTTLVLATLIAGIVLIFFLFVQSRHHTSMVVKQMLTDAIEKRRFEEGISDLAPLQQRLKSEKSLLARYEVEEAVAENSEDKAELRQKVQKKQEAVAQLRSEIQEEQERVRKQAREFAEQAVGEAVSRPMDASDLGHNRFFLEFTTVIVIIVAIISLGLLDVLGGNEIAPLLGSIAGYVLGRTSRNGDQSS
jgi:hypothetical protein